MNESLGKKPYLINTDPMGSGWIFKMKVNNKDAWSRLLDEAKYKALVAKL
ncbi:hypothetical protein [Collimonas sp.]